jgi:hypothetical protein
VRSQVKTPVLQKRKEGRKVGLGEGEVGKEREREREGGRR